MKIITCSSYYGVGSSAFTDLVAEYNSVKDLSNFEFRFLHDLDGVSDLEYHLVENQNRHNSGHALKRFKRLSHFNEGNILSKRYSRFFSGDDYHKLTEEYINSINDFTFRGWWFYDLYDKGEKTYYLYQIVNHLKAKITGSRDQILKKEIVYCPHPTEEEFLEKTRAYVSNLMNSLNKEGKEYLEIDQIVPSSNMERVLRYFSDEIYVFAVDRDPRDIYFSWKYYWKEAIPPHDGVEKFCKWCRFIREVGNGIPSDNDHVMKVQFEDLIYKYDETVEKVEAATGLRSENHTKQFAKMNPLRSVHNTQVWKKHTTDEDLRELAYIEKHLAEYLYDFDGVSLDNVVGIEVTDKRIF